MWAVHFQPEGLPVDDSLLYHAFLFLNEKNSTKVLRTGEELDETDSSQVDFVLSRRTVFAGNLLENSRIVQVLGGSLLSFVTYSVSQLRQIFSNFSGI
jgi:hypothetical protein